MFGVPIRTVLNSDCLLTGALDQAFTLLLGLLAILKSVLMQTFRFGLCFLLQPDAFLTQLTRILERREKGTIYVTMKRCASCALAPRGQ